MAVARNLVSLKSNFDSLAIKIIMRRVAQNRRNETHPI